MIGKSAQLQSIQCGRGIAACLVVLYHTGRMLAEPQYVGHSYILTALFRFGNAGVDFFFVLSGFIIFHVHAADIGHVKRLPHFVRQRVTRIYPLYWLVTSLVIATLVAKHDWPSLNITRLTQSLLLLPGAQDPILGVAWTLVHEVAFYTVFAVAIISRKAGIVVAAMAIALTMVGVDSHWALGDFLQTPFHYEFALGVFAAFLACKAFFVSDWLLAGLGVLFFGLGAWLVDTGALDNIGAMARLWFGGASFFLVIGATRLELRGRISVPALGGYLGAASYAIYLVHTILIGWSAKLLFALPMGREMPAATAVLVFVLAVLGGCALYTWIEIPLQRAVRGKSKTSAPAQPV